MCECEKLRAKRTPNSAQEYYHFKDWTDYHDFKKYINSLNEIIQKEKEAFFSDVCGFATLYKCLKCQRMWRLIEPDPPSRGGWEKYKNAE